MRIRRVMVSLVAVTLLAGCTAQQGELAPVPPQSEPTESLDPASVGPVTPAGTPSVIASGLSAPWSMVWLASGSTLISERDSALVKELTAEGEVREVGMVPGVQPNGEGGLLGLEVAEDDGSWLYAYFTAASDNRIMRFVLEGSAGRYSLGAGEEILTGLAKAGNHNGGRIKVGPDGALYVTVGDAGDPARAQDPTSLNGKILRIDLDGNVPADNPIAGSAVYSMGHRNPQGIAWDRDRRLWAAEFGQNTWDELNLIEAGGNYGWPIVEGSGTDAAYINPVAQWPTNEASPSGLTWTRDTFFMAALRGERVWAIYPGGESPSTVAWFVGEFGRIRDVIPGPDGSLWFMTNNTDGRGDPSSGDDKIFQIALSPLVEG